MHTEDSINVNIYAVACVNDTRDGMHNYRNSMAWVASVFWVGHWRCHADA